MQIENSVCDYDAVEKVNDDMRIQLKAIVQQKFFRYYKVLYATEDIILHQDSNLCSCYRWCGPFLLTAFAQFLCKLNHNS